MQNIHAPSTPVPLPAHTAQQMELSSNIQFDGVITDSAWDGRNVGPLLRLYESRLSELEQSNDRLTQVPITTQSVQSIQQRSEHSTTLGASRVSVFSVFRALRAVPCVYCCVLCDDCARAVDVVVQLMEPLREDATILSNENDRLLSQVSCVLCVCCPA